MFTWSWLEQCSSPDHHSLIPSQARRWMKNTLVCDACVSSTLGTSGESSGHLSTLQILDNIRPLEPLNVIGSFCFLITFCAHLFNRFNLKHNCKSFSFKFQIWLYAGIWPITSVTWPIVASLIGQIPAKSIILHWILFIRSGPGANPIKKFQRKIILYAGCDQSQSSK